MDVSADFGAELPLDNRPAQINLLPYKAASVAAGPAKQLLKIFAFGPVLGSTYSRKLRTVVECRPRGAEVTATIASYGEEVLKDIQWRPVVKVTVAVSRPESQFKMVWKMRSSTGAEVHHAQTPWSTDQVYPIVVEKTLPAVSK